MTRRGGLIWLVGGAMALVLIGAACAGSGSPSGGGGTPVASSPPGGGGGYYGTPSESPSPTQGGGPAAVTVSLINYQFTPSTFSVKKGESVQVKDANPTTPHTFTVDGTTIDVSLNPGDSQTVPIDLAPGTYAFHCRFHQSRGMTGTLTVT